MSPGPPPSTPLVGRLLRAAAVLVPLGVVGNVALTLLTTDRHVLAATRELPLGPLAVAVGLAVVPWVTNTLRLQLWASFVGHPMGFLSGLRIVLGGLLGSAVTPTGSGGAALKWALLARQGVSAGKVGTLLLVETVENAAFMAVAVPLAVFTSAASEVPALREATAATGGGLARPVAAGVAFVAAVCLLGWMAWRGALGRGLRYGALRVRRTLARAVSEGREVAALIARRGRARFALGVTLAAVQWTARYSVATAVLAFLGVDVRPVLFWALQWATFTLMNAVPTPGAAGGAEAVFAVLYSPFVPSDVLGLATAAWRLVLFYAPLSVAAFLFLGLRRQRLGGLPDGPTT